MLRLTARDFERSDIAPGEIGYDAFICHASEDKKSVVRSLARFLDKLGLRVW